MAPLTFWWLGFISKLYTKLGKDKKRCGDYQTVSTVIGKRTQATNMEDNKGIWLGQAFNLLGRCMNETETHSCRAAGKTWAGTTELRWLTEGIKQETKKVQYKGWRLILNLEINKYTKRYVINFHPHLHYFPEKSQRFISTKS